MGRRFLQTIALGVAAAVCAPGAAPAHLRVERTPVAGGAELITYFERLPGGHDELPLLSVLNDRLLSSGQGDDRLRQVWVFTFTPPSIAQRLVGAVPFFYHRWPSGASAGTGPPRPVLDMGVPSRGISSRIAMSVAEAEFINPAGALARLTARSYGGNLGEYRATHIGEAVDAISEDTANELSQDQTALLRSRLLLTGRMFGGLVSDEALPHFSDKYRTEHSEIRGHNWELLRQTAEENGLYFQPLGAFAMVWIARDDLENVPPRFSAQFLKIGNPFGDGRLMSWQGYSETWSLEGRPAIMIPLALYALDYPGVPLLLVDFRRGMAPRRAEMTLRAADDITAGVLGLSGFGFGLGNLGYRALKSGALFVNKRHGGTIDRAARRRAFVQLRHLLGTDESFDPALRAEIARRIEKLDIDPMERSWHQEVQGASRQYEALLKSAADPNGMPRLLAADRAQEARALAHEAGARGLLRAASVGTLGIYRHHDDVTLGKLEEMGEQRRLALLKRTPRQPRPAGSAAGGGE